ncbi:unnamed protein product [Euphydryas editha]|uniref:Uncharacterized protein n=1 Tax=Euphydryas editha TaxID=104508 RepID=A0AAU9UAT3_EUPED|nr:unnamed protein product [Euphydryas editha]
MLVIVDDPDIVADSIAEGVLQSIKLLIPCFAVPIGGKSQPWFGRTCKMAACHKRESYRASANASISQDVKTCALKKKYNFASRSFKRVITEAKAEYVNRISERLVRLRSFAPSSIKKLINK